jgi:uncharacterized protein YcgI (DUF1989 family)
VAADRVNSNVVVKVMIKSYTMPQPFSNIEKESTILLNSHHHGRVHDVQITAQNNQTHRAQFIR